MTCTGCRYGERPTSLARMASGLLEQHVEGAADAARVEGRLVPVDRGLQAVEPLGFHLLGHLLGHLGGRRARAAANI